MIVVAVASGAPVYLYEFQHPPSMIQKNRPSFVGVDHADELFFIQGTCFAQAHLRATGKTLNHKHMLHWQWTTLKGFQITTESSFNGSIFQLLSQRKRKSCAGLWWDTGGTLHTPGKISVSLFFIEEQSIYFLHFNTAVFGSAGLRMVRVWHTGLNIRMRLSISALDWNRKLGRTWRRNTTHSWPRHFQISYAKAERQQST